MRVVVYPADRFACGWYRMMWPAEALAAQGLDVTIVRPGQPTGMGVLKVNGRMSAVSDHECDLVVFQRPAREIQPELARLLRERGIAVVVDVDDDLERIHPSNPAFRGSAAGDFSWRNVRRTCEAATLVTVSTTPLLERYAARAPGRVVPNYLPGRLLGQAREPNASVGWAGALHSHPTDLDCAAPALARLLSEGHELRFVGPSEGLAEKLRVGPDDFTATGDLEFGHWLPNVARLGVGVAPLADTAFNRCKSWLKPLEYSAAGVPWVGSDLPEYRRLAERCGAPMARRPRDWYQMLKPLLMDEARREDLSGRAREMAGRMTIEAHAHLWAEAWTEAVRLERARRPQRCSITLP